MTSPLHNVRPIYRNIRTPIRHAHRHTSTYGHIHTHSHTHADLVDMNGWRVRQKPGYNFGSWWLGRVIGQSTLHVTPVRNIGNSRHDRYVQGRITHCSCLVEILGRVDGEEQGGREGERERQRERERERDNISKS